MESRTTAQAAESGLPCRPFWPRRLYERPAAVEGAKTDGNGSTPVFTERAVRSDCWQPNGPLIHENDTVGHLAKRGSPTRVNCLDQSPGNVSILHVLQRPC